MLLAASNYPLLNLFWTTFIIFGWILWFWLLITVFGDLFRRHDISGWAKAVWVIVLILFPYLGIFIYLISQHRGLAERQAADLAAAAVLVSSLAGIVISSETVVCGEVASSGAVGTK